MLVHEYYLIQFNKRLIISKNYWTLWEVAICKGSPESHFAFLHLFSMGMVLIPVSCTMGDGNIRPPDLPLEKSVCRSGSNS